VEGGAAEAFLQYALTNNVRRLNDGQALYSPICREDGGVLDDLIIYRYQPSRYRIIVNAGNHDKDFAWLDSLAGKFDVELRDISQGLCLLAVQGPEAFTRLADNLTRRPDSLAYYEFTETEAFGCSVFMARTGYTGEPGVEIAMESSDAPRLWDALTGTLGMAPIGLAARDSLRLEACMALYGHELREAWNPFESGVGWAVDMDSEDDFCGKAALAAAKSAGVGYRLVGLEMVGRGIARAGYPVLKSGREIGEVTSGIQSPTTAKAIGLAHIPAENAKIGTALTVEIRGKEIEARVAARPFYRNPALRD
jgi:aminomethyltransferase